jgi:purine-binding chemotaxis protein CheW
MMDAIGHTSAPRQAVANPASEHHALIVTFQLGHQQYGLSLAAVREIVRLPALTALAGASPLLCGLLNLRGRHLPVLDGRALVGEPVLHALSNQIVIAGQGQPELGILVDHVHDVCTVAIDRIVPIDRPDIAPFLTSVFGLAEESVLLFDLAALLVVAHKRRKRKTQNGATRRAPKS